MSSFQSAHELDAPLQCYVKPGLRAHAVIRTSDTQRDENAAWFKRRPRMHVRAGLSQPVALASESHSKRDIAVEVGSPRIRSVDVRYGRIRIKK
jgi:hypothetical protein